ncbi:MAG: hypothetical protein G01um101470_152, partial [Parcubacteria group bacterium Gr01-1014_70]
GYVTIDQALIRPNIAHRRPGLHVDGIGPEGYQFGQWGGGWSGRSSFLMAASHAGCLAWDMDFKQEDMVPDGDCEHLRHFCCTIHGIELQPGRIYEVGRLTPHETFSLPFRVLRQFIRLSSPSNAPTHKGLTRNSLGVQHTGVTLPARPECFRSWGDQHALIN